MDELKTFEKINEPLSPRARKIFFGVFLLVLLGGYMLYRTLVTFDAFEVSSSFERKDAEQTHYVDFMDNLLAYGRDGAFYTDYDGNLIWNETYEMTNPQIKICEGKLLIYDKSGSRVFVETAAGNEGKLSTNLPIIDADVASNGNVVVLMQNKDTGYLNLYNSEGATLASGELHTKNTGYPMSVAISSSGDRLVVSLTNLTDGDVKSTVLFYDFGVAGEKKDDHIVGKFSYSNMVIPEVDFVAKDEAIAFGDSEIVVYSNGKEPKIKKELFVSKEMKSIFHNDNYFGFITADENGQNTLSLYNMSMSRRFEKQIEEVFTKVSISKANEVMLTDGENVSIYTSLGVNKFVYDFSNGIVDLIPWESYRTYIVIEKGTVERIRLK